MMEKLTIDCPTFLQSSKNPIYFIAEIGGNHEGNFNRAQRQLDLAIEAGVDAVKFQIYRGDRLVSPVENESRNNRFRDFELTKDEFEKLATKANEHDIDFLASVWDKKSLEWVNPMVPFHKIGSGDLTAFPLIRQMAETGKPILLSTGLSTLEEVRRTVDFIKKIDSSYITENKLVLLQCNSMYPTPDRDAHIRAMHALEEACELPVGYSDHTFGTEAAYLATLAGACVLELHFTDKREDQDFRDHHISVKQDEVPKLMERIRRAETLLGEDKKQVTPSEKESGHVTSFRRAVYATEKLSVGDKITHENSTVLRPEHGIPAWRYDDVLGRQIVTERKQFEPIREEDIQ
jgi:N-acetylneuraminate synthase/N,N'-diacetyllegionaminate synthase